MRKNYARRVGCWNLKSIGSIVTPRQAGRFRFAPVLGVVVACAFSVAAQRPVSRLIDTARIENGNTEDQLSETRRLAFLRLHSFADAILGFQDKTAKPLALARLADLTWQEEEAYSRKLFKAALDCTSASADTPVKEATILRGLRRSVISLIRRHDVEWAKELLKVERDPASERMEDNFAVAYDALAKDPANAVTFAELSLRDGVFPYMSSFLRTLRLRDEAAANALFVKALDSLLQMNQVDGNELLHLGTYVFTSPLIDVNDSGSPPEAVVQRGIGNLLVYDITADRPGVSLQLIRAYLGAAGLILANSRFLDNQQRHTYYVASRLLLPKAEKFAPELIGVFASAMAQLSGAVPAELTDDSTFAKFEPKTGQTLDQKFKEIDKLPLELQRNEKYFFLFHALWSKGDLANARTTAERITDLEVRPKLRALVDFKTAVSLLEQTQPSAGEAEKIAAQLPADIERAVLWLAIGALHVKAADKEATLNAVSSSLNTTRKLKDARQPLLFLSAASQFCSVDPTLAATALSETVRAFNAQTSEPADPVFEEVTVGHVKLYFALRAKGFEFRMSPNLRAVTLCDLEGTLSTVTDLRSEAIKSEAFVVIATATLRPGKK